MTDDHTKIAKMQAIALRAGMIWLAVSVLMTGAAGWSFGSGNMAKQILFMFGFPLITIGAAVLLPLVEHALDRKAFALAFGLLVPAWAVCTVGEGFGHLMIIASQHDSSKAGAAMDQVKWDNANTSVNEQATKLKVLTDRQSQLKAAWGDTSITPDGLKADLVVLNKQIELETNRGGCKAKCADWMTKKSGIEKQLASITEFNALRDQIDAATKGADNARAELAKLKMGHSDAASQTKVTAKLFTANLRPDADEQERASIMLELVFVAAFLLGPMTLIAVGVRDFNKQKRKGGGTFKRIGGIFSSFARWLMGMQAPVAIVDPKKAALNYDATRMREVVEEWAGHRTLKVPGKTISLQASYAHYCNFAHELSVAPVDLIMFKASVEKQLGTPIAMNNDEWFAGYQFRTDSRALA